MSAGAPWGPQHPGALGGGVGDEAATMPWAQVHRGSGKGADGCGFSPHPTPQLGGVGPHGGSVSPDDTHGGVVLSPHIYRLGCSPLPDSWRGIYRLARVTRDMACHQRRDVINVCHLPGLLFNDAARC